MKFALIRFIISALLTLFLVVNFSDFSQQIIAQTSISSLLQQGLEEYQNDNFTAALETWQNALEHTENSDNKALIYNYLSLVQQRLGKWEEAQNSIDLARELLPKNAPDLHARILNTQGRLYWSLGQPENALKQWQKATQLYRQADRIDGAIGTGINQALALQTLGFSLDAEQQLEAINGLVEELPNDSPLKLMGYQRLGQVWRQLGKLEESRTILTKAKDLPIADGKIWLELGNTERTLSDRAVIFGEKTTEIEKYNQAALNSYQKAIEFAETDSQKLQAQLNTLSFLIELGDWEKAIALQQKLQPLIDRFPASRSSIEAQLSFNRSLICLWDRDNPENVPGCSYRHENLTKQFNPLTGEQIAYNLAKIVERSQTLTDSLAESSARGLLGEIYERTGQWPEARNLTREALQLAEDRQALDLRYRWEWQLGRLLKKQGQPQSAIAAYKASVKTLSKVRDRLLPIDSNVQFNFRDNIEPVYRELVDLLITENAEDEESQKEAVGLIDELQLAELEDFLRCRISPTFSIADNLEVLDRKAALIYPVFLGNKLVIFSKFPGETMKHNIINQSRETVEEVARDLQNYIIQRKYLEEVIQNAEQLYDWLLEPLETKLEQNQNIQTVVFILDGFLRNIPISVLRDSDPGEFVLEKSYSISILPNLQVFALNSFPRNQINILAAGMSKDPDGEEDRFKGLKYVMQELEQIENTFPAQILRDSEFSFANLQKKLRSRPFSILHLATHGQFSADRTQSFIFADDRKLRETELKQLIEIQSDRHQSFLELLVLSACETATGDDRAILGLSGFAVRSGAKSTLSTLWQVNDESTAFLMEYFYNQLAQNNSTKAKALQQAQRDLFEQGYKNPFYWAPYILIGNWL